MPKIQLHPNLAKLKEVLESGHNLVDHFLVCGIPPNTCLQDFLYDTKDPKYEENFKENIKPSIISRFPEFDNSIDSVDDEIISYCFPNGFKPIFSNDCYLESKTKFYTLILDNNLFSIEHPQKYLSCLLFYENISSYSDLKKKLEEKEEEKEEEIDIFNIDEVEEIEIEKNKEQDKKENKDNNDNKDNNESDKIKEENEIKKERKEKYLMKNIFQTLIVKKKSEELTLQKTLSMKKFKKLNTSENLALNQLRRSSKISEKESFIYIPKVICLVSTHPYIKTFEKILKSIYSLFIGDIEYDKDIPLEKIITNLIIEVPIPPRGLYSIHYEFLDNKYIFKGYENNKILVTENNLNHFNSVVNFKTKLEVFKHILFCSKVLFFSTNLNLITETILSFLVLLYPFKYPFQVTSYVQKDTYDILGCFTPFMFGINEPYNENFMEENDIITDDMNIFMVDLDHLDQYKLISSEEFPNFPSKLTSNLEKEIKNLENKYKKESNINLEEFNELYQNIFFEFFCEILKGYEDYLNMDYFKVSNKDKTTSTATLFQCPKFVKMHSSSEVAFYDKFVDISQLFADFIYKRMIPRNNQEVIDVLFVNETNIKIKNKSKYFGQKESTDFLDSNEYFPSNKYIVPGPRKITPEEYDAIEEKKDELLTFGQQISYSDEKIIRINTIKDNENNKGKENKTYKKMIFNYVLFPQLDFKIYCNPENVNDYYPPPDYTEEIEAINSDLLSKSSIGQNINLGLEMMNNLYLTWLEIWSYTFWYIDKDEREYRFDQALDILDKVIHHEINIFNLMFDVLNQQNEQEMIIKLYQKMLLLKINPNTNIHNIISNILDSDQIKLLLDKMKSDGNIISLKFNKKYTTRFKTRTFLNLEDKPSLVNERLKFDTVFSCIDCMEEINLYKLCKDFEGIKNDVLWAPCINGHYNLPKLKISFGTEIFPFNIIKNPNNSTSTLNDIVLHSPYNLKINIKNAMKNKYGTKLDVNKFKSDFCALFWNFVWYCKIYGLDYSILLPYKDRIEQIRLSKIVYNPNLNNIKLLNDNNIFKSMEYKFKEIESGLVKNESQGSIILDNNFQNLKIEKVETIKIQKALKKKHIKLFGKLFGSFLSTKSKELDDKNKKKGEKV